MTTVKDLFVVGKPILLTARSSNAAEMMVKEEAILIGAEPREYDAEFADENSVKSDWASFSPGDFILVTNARRADQATQEALTTLIHDQDKTVVVADSTTPKFMPPDKFAHWCKF